LFAGEEVQTAWKELEYCVRTGNPVFRRRGLDDPFTDPAWRAEDKVNFDAAMADFRRLAAISGGADHDFVPLRRVVDVGGGNGALLIGILTAHPHLHGVVFDQPHAAERVKKQIAESGLADRCEALAETFSRKCPTVPTGISSKHVIHDWNDD